MTKTMSKMRLITSRYLAAMVGEAFISTPTHVMLAAKTVAESRLPTLFVILNNVTESLRFSHSVIIITQIQEVSNGRMAGA